MLDVDQSEIALIQRQFERAHVEHPTAAMGLALWPSRSPNCALPDVPPFNRSDGRIVNEYDHSRGHVRIFFYGSEEAVELYKQITTAACRAMPTKTSANNWQESLFEQRESYGKLFHVVVDRPRFVPLRENPFLASAMALQRRLHLPPIDTEALRRRSLQTLRDKFERAAERSRNARHYVVICGEEPVERDHGEYAFKMLDGRWWRCRAEGMNMDEFGTLCREAAHICQDDTRCSLMPQPQRYLCHDDAWMIFVHRLAWRQPLGTALLAFTEMEGGSEVSSETAMRESSGLMSTLRSNFYSACVMAIDVILAMPNSTSSQIETGRSGSAALGNAVITARLERLTLAEIGERCNRSRSTVKGWLRGVKPCIPGSGGAESVWNWSRIKSLCEQKLKATLD